MYECEIEIMSAGSFLWFVYDELKCICVCFKILFDWLICAKTWRFLMKIIYLNYHGDFVILEPLVNLNRVIILKGLRLCWVHCLGQSSCVGFVLGLFRS